MPYFGRKITKYTGIYGVYIWFWPTLTMPYFGRKTTKYTVIYGVYIWFWPTLPMPYFGRHMGGKGNSYVPASYS
jgi:hypothetical protein